MNNTPEGTFDYDVTEGGVLVYYGPEAGLDLTSPSDNPLLQLANIERVSDVLRKLVDRSPAIGLSELPGLIESGPLPGLVAGLYEHAPEILVELSKLAAEIGEPCGVCGGDGGQEIGYGPIRWADCGACSGTRVQAAA